MWLFSFFQQRRSRKGVIGYSANVMRERYSDDAPDLAREFVVNALDQGDQYAVRHWTAVRLELKRLTVRLGSRSHLG